MAMPQAMSVEDHLNLSSPPSSSSSSSSSTLALASSTSSPELNSNDALRTPVDTRHPLHMPPWCHQSRDAHAPFKGHPHHPFIVVRRDSAGVYEEERYPGQIPPSMDLDTSTEDTDPAAAAAAAVVTDTDTDYVVPSSPRGRMLELLDEHEMELSPPSPSPRSLPLFHHLELDNDPNQLFRHSKQSNNNNVDNNNNHNNTVRLGLPQQQPAFSLSLTLSLPSTPFHSHTNTRILRPRRSLPSQAHAHAVTQTQAHHTHLQTSRRHTADNTSSLHAEPSSSTSSSSPPRFLSFSSASSLVPYGHAFPGPQEQGQAQESAPSSSGLNTTTTPAIPLTSLPLVEPVGGNTMTTTMGLGIGIPPDDNEDDNDNDDDCPELSPPSPRYSMLALPPLTDEVLHPVHPNIRAGGASAGLGLGPGLGLALGLGISSNDTTNSSGGNAANNTNNNNNLQPYYYDHNPSTSHSTPTFSTHFHQPHQFQQPNHHHTHNHLLYFTTTTTTTTPNSSSTTSSSNNTPSLLFSNTSTPSTSASSSPIAIAHFRRLEEHASLLSLRDQTVHDEQANRERNRVLREYERVFGGLVVGSSSSSKHTPVQVQERREQTHHLKPLFENEHQLEQHRHLGETTTEPEPELELELEPEVEVGMVLDDVDELQAAPTLPPATSTSPPSPPNNNIQPSYRSTATQIILERIELKRQRKKDKERLKELRVILGVGVDALLDLGEHVSVCAQPAFQPLFNMDTNADADADTHPHTGMGLGLVWDHQQQQLPHALLLDQERPSHHSQTLAPEAPDGGEGGEEGDNDNHDHDDEDDGKSEEEAKDGQSNMLGLHDQPHLLPPPSSSQEPEDNLSLLFPAPPQTLLGHIPTHDDNLAHTRTHTHACTQQPLSATTPSSSSSSSSSCFSSASISPRIAQSLAARTKAMLKLVARTTIRRREVAMKSLLEAGSLAEVGLRLQLELQQGETAAAAVGGAGGGESRYRDGIQQHSIASISANATATANADADADMVMPSALPLLPYFGAKKGFRGSPLRNELVLLPCDNEDEDEDRMIADDDGYDYTQEAADDRVAIIDNSDRNWKKWKWNNDHADDKDPDDDDAHVYEDGQFRRGGRQGPPQKRRRADCPIPGWLSPSISLSPLPMPLPLPNLAFDITYSPAQQCESARLVDEGESRAN